MFDLRRSFKKTGKGDHKLYQSMRRAQVRILLGRIGLFWHVLYARINSDLFADISNIRHHIIYALTMFFAKFAGITGYMHSRRTRQSRDGRNKNKGLSLQEAFGAAYSRLPVSWHRFLCRIPNFRLGRLASLFFAVSIFVLVAMWQLFSLGLQVWVNDRYLGSVASQAVYEQAADMAEQQAGRCLGQVYNLKFIPHFTLGVVRKDELVSASDMSALLFSQINEIQNLYVVYVNGTIMGAVLDDKPVRDFLQQNLAKYNTGTPNTTVKYAQDISIELKSIDLKYYLDSDSLITKLSSYTTQAKTYTVKPGEALSQIALDNNMRLSQLLQINPEIDQNNIKAGQVIYLTRSVPVLSVDVVRLVTYTQSIPYNTVKQNSASLYTNQTKVKVAGSNGQAKLTAYVSYRDGVEYSRDIVSREVVKQPVDKVVLIGTKALPAKAATGKFRWPTSGIITSPYGYRHGEFHTGMDIANKRGTPIYAADGGTVVLVKSLSYSYGNYIVIDHGNGYKTLYGHNSIVLVTIGQKVAKGQLIAKMGATGRATGSHCHFEIIKDGSTVNPMLYLR